MRARAKWIEKLNYLEGNGNGKRQRQRNNLAHGFSKVKQQLAAACFF
jgi:hypothetical protein